MSFSRVQKSFDKACNSYHANSHVQRDMAGCLFDMLPSFTRECVFEAGCGTGNLTEYLIKNNTAKNLVINDISSLMLHKCQERTEGFGLKKLEHIAGDFMHIESSCRYDLVISNAMLQWCTDLKSALMHLKAMLKDKGELAFSSFGPENFREFKKALHIGLDYKNKDEICSCLDDLGFKYTFKELMFKEYFNSCHDLLSYIKHTGVGGVNTKPLSFKELKHFMAVYDRDFKEGQRVYLTWHQYFVYATL